MIKKLHCLVVVSAIFIETQKNFNKVLLKFIQMTAYLFSRLYSYIPDWLIKTENILFNYKLFHLQQLHEV